MALETTILDPGTRVRVTQQVPQTHQVWSTSTEGVVVRYRQAQTGNIGFGGRRRGVGQGGGCDAL